MEVLVAYARLVAITVTSIGHEFVGRWQRQPTRIVGECAPECCGCDRPRLQTSTESHVKHPPDSDVPDASPQSTTPCTDAEFAAKVALALTERAAQAATQV